MQNPEPSVEFDTVANKKQQHEVNVGKTRYPCLYTCILIDLDHPEPVCSIILIKLLLWIQQSQIHLGLEGTTRWWHFQPSSRESLLLVCSAFVRKDDDPKKREIGICLWMCPNATFCQCRNDFELNSSFSWTRIFSTSTRLYLMRQLMKERFCSVLNPYPLIGIINYWV